MIANKLTEMVASWYCWYSATKSFMLDSASAVGENKVNSGSIAQEGSRLTEFHLVHSLSSVPMQESLPPEHDNKLITNTLEHLLDTGRVSDKGGAHLQTSGWD